MAGGTVPCPFVDIGMTLLVWPWDVFGYVLLNARLEQRQTENRPAVRIPSPPVADEAVWKPNETGSAETSVHCGTMLNCGMT